MVQEKWKAWNKLRGLSKEKAEAEYIALVESLNQRNNLYSFVLTYSNYLKR